MKLLNSTRQLYTSDTAEFSTVPSGPSPGSRPVGRNTGWSPQGGIIATSTTATTVSAGVPFGAKRAPGRKVDPSKRVSESLVMFFMEDSKRILILVSIFISYKLGNCAWYNMLSKRRNTVLSKNLSSCNSAVVKSFSVVSFSRGGNHGVGQRFKCKR